jgi:hypothetical protein
MRMIKPADGRRLETLLHRVQTLRRCGVKIQPDHVEALRRVVDILLHDERAAERKRNVHPPPGFGEPTLGSLARGFDGRAAQLPPGDRE